MNTTGMRSQVSKPARWAAWGRVWSQCVAHMPIVIFVRALRDALRPRSRSRSVVVTFRRR